MNWLIALDFKKLLYTALITHCEWPKRIDIFGTC